MATERDETYWLRGAITTLEAQVEGLEYELHVREFRLKEQDQVTRELKARTQGDANHNPPRSSGNCLPSGYRRTAFFKAFCELSECRAMHASQSPPVFAAILPR